MELQRFVVSILVQTRAGGNLAELLETLAATSRKRLKLKGRLRALTSEGRIQAVVLMMLPVITLLSMQVLSPEYISCLMERPSLLVGMIAAQLIGAVWIRSIVNSRI
jgi:tight adherence protein B